MAHTIKISDDLYAQLGKLARPFKDKEVADVISWLVENATKSIESRLSRQAPHLLSGSADVEQRTPRERGALINIGGHTIKALTVADMSQQVMEFLFSAGHGGKILELVPYSTSTKRYLFAKKPVHPKGNEFVAPIKCRGLYIETHKNYKTAIEQLARLSSKCGVRLAYKSN